MEFGRWTNRAVLSAALLAAVGVCAAKAADGTTDADVATETASAESGESAEEPKAE